MRPSVRASSGTELMNVVETATATGASAAVQRSTSSRVKATRAS